MSLNLNYQAADMEEETRWLTELDSLGVKTPKRHKQIIFVDESDSNTRQHGLVVFGNKPLKI
jgi:hypothetical protein